MCRTYDSRRRRHITSEILGFPRGGHIDPGNREIAAYVDFLDNSKTGILKYGDFRMAMISPIDSKTSDPEIGNAGNVHTALETWWGTYGSRCRRIITSEIMGRPWVDGGGATAIREIDV